MPAEYKFVRKDGTTFPALITATPSISGKKMTGLRGVVIDITERKKAEESLKESEEKFRTLSEQSPNMIFINKRGRVVYTNKKCEDTMGYTKKEFYSPNFDFLSLYAPEYVEEVKSFYAEQMRGEAVHSYEGVLVTREGERINAITTTKLIEYEGEKAVLGIVTDITERKKAEEVLRESEESFRSLIDSMDDLVFVLGFDGVFKNYHQPSHNKKLYVQPEEFIGKHFLNVLPPQVAELCQAAMKRIEDSGETQEFDYFMGMNGEKSWYNARLSPAIDKSGRKTSVTVVVRNITERKKAEQAVSASLKRYQSFIEVTGELGWTTNDAGEVLEDIPSFRNFTGQTYDEVKGWGWTKAVHPEDVEHATQAWQAAVTAKTKYEVEYRLRRLTAFTAISWLAARRY